MGGFYSVLQCVFHVLGNYSIIALVEQWQCMTHTLYFRCGETKITLKDVSIIWDLKIDGKPVTEIYDPHTVEE